MKIIFYILFLNQYIYIFARLFDWAEIENVQHGSVDVLVQNPQHKLNDGSVGNRFINKLVNLITPYDDPPLIAVGINKIKCNQNVLFNLMITVINKTTNTFTLQIRVKDSQQCDYLSINYITVPANQSVVSFRYFSEDITGKEVNNISNSFRQSNLEVVLNPTYINIPLLCGYSIITNDSQRISLSLGVNENKTKFTISTDQNNQIVNVYGFHVEIIVKDNSDYGFAKFSNLVGIQSTIIYMTEVLSLKNSNIIPFVSYSSFDFDKSYPLIFQQVQVQLISDQYQFQYGPDIPSILYGFNLIYFNLKNKICDKSEYLLNNIECVQTCPSQYYSNSALKICSQCHPSCLTCENSDSQNSCKTCDITKNLSNGMCICKSGYYSVPNEQNYKCYGCSFICELCEENSQKCTQCGLNRYLEGSTCKCIDGYWDAISSAFCPKCFRNCKTCGEGQENNCLSCNEGYSLSAENICVCQYGFYDDPVYNTCQECHQTCSRCNGKSDTDCLECSSNRVLLINKCICPLGYSELNQNDKLICIPDKQQSCTKSCKKCQLEYYGNEDNQNYKSFNKCIQCEEDRVLVDGECICIDGMYEVDIEYCFPCDKSCKTCFGGDKNSCLSCHDFRNLRNDYSCEDVIQLESEDNSDNIEAYIIMLVVFSTVIAVAFAIYFYRKYEYKKLNHIEEFQKIQQDHIEIKLPQKEKKKQKKNMEFIAINDLLKENALEEFDNNQNNYQQIQRKSENEIDTNQIHDDFNLNVEENQIKQNEDISLGVNQQDQIEDEVEIVVDVQD